MNKKKATGISLIALIITIIVIIILAAIVVSSGLKTPESAGKAKFLGDLSQIKESVSIKRVQNLMQTVENPTGDKNYGFTKVIIRKTADSEPEDGWVVNLEVLNIKNSTRGMAYAEVIEGSEIIFGADAPDVYVYDSKGEIYYARGYRDGKNIIYAQSYITGIDDAPGNWTYSTVAGTDIILDDTFDDSAFVKINGRSEQYIPSGYTFYDYIESTGTQYINTGVNPNANTKIEVKYQITNISDIQYMGSLTTGMGRNIIFGSNQSYELYYANKTYVTGIAKNTDINTVVIDGKNKISYFNSNSYDFSAYTFDSASDYPLFLFALNRNGTSDNFCKAKVYYSKIYDNGTLIRNFIGAKRNSDNAIGMYDLANNVFYTNAGTGNFIAGNVITLPHPDHPIEMKSVQNFNLISVGKNLLPNNIFINGYNINAPYTPNGDVRYKSIDKLFLKAGSYTFSSSANISIRLFNVTNQAEITSGVASLPRTFTLTGDSIIYAYFRNSAGASTDWLWSDYPSSVNLQLEFGSLATPYEPFKGQTVINFPYTLRSLPDGTKDYIEIDNVNKTAKLYQNVGEYILTGAEVNWVRHSTILNLFVLSLSSLNSSNEETDVICMSTNYVGSAYYPQTTGHISMGGATRNRIMIRDNRYIDNLDGFKAWLASQHSAGTPVTVQYKLATPIITNLDYEEVVTYYPYTKIYTNAVIQPNMEVTYKKLESQ